jgi:hypothetical protein
MPTQEDQIKAIQAMTNQEVMTTIAISAESLLALPHADLIALYNAESRRLAGPLTAHTVDSTCKPLYIVKRLARLPVYYQMMGETASNESAAMLSQPLTEEAERGKDETESARESAPLTRSSGFSLMR